MPQVGGMQSTPPLSSLPSSRPLLTPRQIAEQLQCSYSMALGLIRRGELRAVYVGRLPRVRAVDLETYIERGDRR